MEPETRPETAHGPAPPILLSAVIVNFRSWPDVEGLVDSLLGSPLVVGGVAEVVVVDNASPEPAPAALLAPRAGLRLILRGQNDGFAAGVNAGRAGSRGSWLLVLNPDIVAEAGAFDRVIGRVEGLVASRVGVVGFGLRNPDGSRQPSVGAFPGLFRSIREQFIPRHRRKYHPDRRARGGPVDWVTGACMLLDARMLDEVGGMDEDFFLYHEEVALCKAARNRGWSVIYDPSVSFVHRHPLQNRAISPKMRAITRHGKLLYFRKHCPAWQFRALRRIVLAEALARGAWSRLLGRRDEARGWRAVAEVARRLKDGVGLKGRAVLELAESTLAGGGIVAKGRDGPRRTHDRSRPSRAIRPRKDGA